MYGKNVKLRFLFLFLILVSVILSVSLILQSLKKNVVYFQSPSEIQKIKEISKKKIRVGGMVKENSIIIDSDKINFIITDFKNEINVIYSGAVPNLFEEGKGVVAEGFLKDRNYFSATKILAKHDENYMPPEVKEAIGDK
jgi:cytochrome c-type biogenesis protein CcmE